MQDNRSPRLLKKVRKDIYLSNHLQESNKENFRYLDDLPPLSGSDFEYDGGSVYSLKGFANRNSELGGTGDEDARYSASFAEEERRELLKRAEDGDKPKT